MSTNGSKAWRKYTLTVLMLIGFFLAAGFGLYQIAAGGKNEEHLADIVMLALKLAFYSGALGVLGSVVLKYLPVIGNFIERKKEGGGE